MCSKTSCLDAACLARSTTMLHASNLVITKLLDEACGSWTRAPWLARSGFDWLDLAAPGALAGSICLPWSPLGALTGSIWLQTTAQTTRLAKKNDLLIEDLASTLPASCALDRLFMPQI